MPQDRTRATLPYPAPAPSGGGPLATLDLALDLRDMGCRIRSLNPTTRRLFDVGSAQGAFGPNALLPQVRSLNRQAWDFLCDSPLDPAFPEDVWFPGGQCPTLYTVASRVRTRAGTDATASISNVQGPIRRIFWEETELAFPQPRVNREVFVVDANSNVLQFNATSQFTDSAPGALKWLVITRMDGLPDNCGSSPPQLPALPPPQNFYDINIRIGGIEAPVRVELPDLDFSGWPEFTFSPHIRIGDVDVFYTPEGITIEAPAITLNNLLSPQVAVDLSPVLNAISSSNTQIENSIQNVNINIDNQFGEQANDLERIEKLIECCCCERGTLQVETLATNTEGGQFALPENTKIVEIQAQTPITPGTKIQSGSGSSPDIYFWGSYSIGYRGNSGGERIPLSFERNAYRVDKFAQTVTVLLNFGNRATIKAHYLECE